MKTRFNIDKTLEKEIDTTKRHRLITKSDYFCLSLRLMNSKANVLWGMWNNIQQFKNLGGKERSIEINGEFSSNKIA